MNDRSPVWTDAHGRTASWEYEHSHWDVTDRTGKKRYDRYGNFLPKEIAHKPPRYKTAPLENPTGARVVRSGRITRAVRALGVLGGIAALATASASAESIACNLRNFADDRMKGEDDWAYVDALSVRHELNQHGLFAGDIAMRSMYGWK